MQSIKFICGEWSKVPSALQVQCFIPVIGAQTEEQVAQMGLDLISNPRPQVIFTNNSIIFNAMRVAVKRCAFTDPPIEIIFFKGNLVHHLNIDVDGNVNHWPPGFFTKAEELLNELL